MARNLVFGTSSGTRLGRRATVVASVMAVLATYAVAGPVSSASASSLAGSGFEIETDSNLTLEGATSPPAFDWLTAAKTVTPGVKVKADDPSGSSDDSFSSTKEDDNVPFVADGSIPPSKSDLKQFGVYVEKTGSATFLNVFWSRIQDPHGSTDMDFEFNQSPLTINGSSFPAKVDKVIPKRTAGDLLLMYSLQSSGDTPVITKATWVGTAAAGHWGPQVALTGAQAIGTINSSAITAANSGNLGPYDPFTFGEASVDLAALVGTDQGCVTYGSAYLKSRSGPQFTSELKDFIAPEPVSISNCGSLKLHKTDGTNALQGAVFTLWNNVAPLAAPIGVGDTATALTCTTDASGDCAISNIPKGSYLLHETPLAGYDPVADQPVVITAGDQEVDLGTLVDPIKTGTITIIKDAVPNDAQDFSFRVHGGGLAPEYDSGTFSLDDDADATLSNTWTHVVPIGAYSAAELSIPATWTLSGLTCVDPTTNSTTSLADHQATINLAQNETVTCTFTNTPVPHQPPMTTQVASAGGGGWNDTATLTGDGTHAVTGTVSFWACQGLAAAADCVGGTQVGGAAAVGLNAGSSYTATTTAPFVPTAAGWTCFRASFTSSSPFYSNTSHTNATTECFLKQAANLTVSKTATAAFGRLYSWTIDKVVADPEVHIALGGTATSHYKVTVANTHVDSAWTVTGTITVNNPNPVPFTGVTVTDAIDNGAGSCLVTSGSNATVPANNKLELGYTCTYASAPSPAFGTNTATAAWSSAAYFTPAASATGTATVDFASVTPSVTDEIVSLSDTVQGSLGTLDARTAQNPTVIEYTVDRSGVAGTCTTYPNTASAVANDSDKKVSDDASVKICVGANLTADATANGGRARDDLWTIAKSVDKTRVEVGQGGTATFNYQVVVTPAGEVDSNYTLTGLVNVHNPNDWETVTANVTVTSDVGGGVSCVVTGGTNASIPHAGTSLPYTCSFSGKPADSGTVTAHVSWSAAAASTPGSSATGGASVTFAIGSETHSSVTVVDDKTDPANPVTLGTRAHADGAHTYSYSVTKSGVAGDCTSYTNTATLTETAQSDSKTVTVCVGLDLSVTKTALATDHRTFLWDINKDVDKTTQSIAAGGTATYGYTVTVTPSGTTDDGWSVTGQIKVTNPNKWEAITATITDAVDSGGGPSCLVDNGTSREIAAQATVTLDYTCTFASEPADGTNTATASWVGGATPHTSATGTASVVFVPSSKTNETITVVDDKTDPGNPVTLGTATYGDGPKDFTYSIDKQGVAGTCTDYTNTATISETEQSDSAVAELCVGSGLVVTGSATGSFDRDYLWTIDKAVDRTRVQLTEGQTAATFHYTVTATPGGVSDSGYAVGGSITLTNPNDWEDVVAGLTVTTDLGGGSDCAVTDGVGKTVPKGAAVTLTYACTFTSAPSSTGTVTATATWDAAAAFTPNATATLDSPVELVLDGQSHAVVTVVDDKTNPGTDVTLGTAAWADGPKEFTYSLSKTPATACTTYTNTATLVETEQSDSQAVVACPFTGGGGVIVVPPTLPMTGDISGLLARWALSMLAAGAVLVLIGRRRRTA